MPDHVEFAYVLYGSDLQPNEKAGLQPMESAIINTLIDHSLPPNPIWMEGLNPGPRSLQLYVFDNDNPRPVVEILADQIKSITEKDLIAIINRNVSKHWDR